MRCTLFILLGLALGSCGPPTSRVTLGESAQKPLKVTELQQDSENRLALLAQQTSLSNNAVFSGYRANAASNWQNNWTRRIDLSGVSWSQRQAGTAITPRHIVYAGHYPIKKNKPISFHDRQGNLHRRKIIKAISLRRKELPVKFDVIVGLLDLPLPPEVKTYRLLPLRSDYQHTLIDVPILVTEQKRQVFINRIRRVTGRNLSMKYDKEETLWPTKPLVKGDSGHPSFILVGGEPVLVETHTGGGSGTGPFYSGEELLPNLEKAVADLDASYRIQYIPLDREIIPASPEPEPRAPTTRTSPIRFPTSQPQRPQSGQTTTPSTPSPRRPRVRRVPTNNADETSE